MRKANLRAYSINKNIKKTEISNNTLSMEITNNDIDKYLVIKSTVILIKKIERKIEI